MGVSGPDNVHMPRFLTFTPNPALDVSTSVDQLVDAQRVVPLHIRVSEARHAGRPKAIDEAQHRSRHHANHRAAGSAASASNVLTPTSAAQASAWSLAARYKRAAFATGRSLSFGSSRARAKTSSRPRAR